MSPPRPPTWIPAARARVPAPRAPPTPPPCLRAIIGRLIAARTVQATVRGPERAFRRRAGAGGQRPRQKPEKGPRARGDGAGGGRHMSQDRLLPGGATLPRQDPREATASPHAPAPPEALAEALAGAPSGRRQDYFGQRPRKCQRRLRVADTRRPRSRRGRDKRVGGARTVGMPTVGMPTVKTHVCPPVAGGTPRRPAGPRGAARGDRRPGSRAPGGTPPGAGGGRGSRVPACGMLPPAAHPTQGPGSSSRGKRSPSGLLIQNVFARGDPGRWELSSPSGLLQPSLERA